MLTLSSLLAFYATRFFAFFGIMFCGEKNCNPNVWGRNGVYGAVYRKRLFQGYTVVICHNHFNYNAFRLHVRTKQEVLSILERAKTEESDVDTFLEKTNFVSRYSIEDLLNFKYQEIVMVFIIFIFLILVCFSV
jgi:hypothetical protein